VDGSSGTDANALVDGGHGSGGGKVHQDASVVEVMRMQLCVAEQTS